ncbi:twin-arginine translocation signal domain-containing protein [Caballeronia sp. ATUFL_F1_KS39]|uniref:twin-arginine translocation signal domain-containing protein n=1 Tax=Caballeronia sp. ATUFL_F1_KS39 TaxID=2921766 RepID=UPI0020282F45|nr:twin-arginine translocation signal domain-containing protein [Caballeronia sp. ATUFL_F1_KS39]
MRDTIIPIVAQRRAHDGEEHHDHDDIAAPPNIALTRREFLHGTGVLVGTIAATSIFASLAPSRVWALEMQGLDTHQGEVLLQVTRQIYPHATLDDAVYALVVKDLDAKAKADPAVRQQLADGVAQLDAKAGSDWTRRGANDKAQDVAALAGTPFFNTVRSTAVVSLYSNALAYQHFGYGASKGDGGYLYQGFNNLSWLPDPPLANSGPIPKDS